MSSQVDNSRYQHKYKPSQLVVAVALALLMSSGLPSQCLRTLVVQLFTPAVAQPIANALAAWFAPATVHAAALQQRTNGDQPIQWVTIGNRLWLEDDYDGNAETWMALSVGAGHIVRATASDGITVYTGVTDAYGFYAIEVPAFDTYVVTADPISGYMASPVWTDNGSDPATYDNRNHDATGTTVVMTDGDNLSIDFAFYHHVKRVQLGDRLWLEDDNDGDATTGTITPIGPGHLVTALASDGVTAYTGVTDDNGYYIIPVPEYDSYTVTTDLPAGVLDTPVWTAQGNNPSQYNDKNHDRTGTIVEIEDKDNLSIDFGFTTIPQPKPVSLGNYVWVDGDGDGTQNEPISAGLDGVTVTLTYPDGAAQATVTSDGGYYYFTELQPNRTYTVHFSLPAGYAFTTPNQGNDELDSDAPASGTVVVNLGQTDDFTIDAGLVKLPEPRVAVGDRVWLDANLDGQQNDAFAPIVSGLTVTLLDSNGQPVATTTTNAAGYYSFTNLLPGDYVVAVQLPAGYGVTTGGADPDDDNSNSDSNALLDGNRMVSPAVTLSVGAEPLNDNLTQAGEDGNGNGTVDFGLIKLISLGDFVWDDLNHNGQQNTDEPGIADVPVTLTTAGGFTLTTTTNASGYYSFTNLAPNATYVVTFATPADYAPTQANRGDDTTDSDAVNGQVTVALQTQDDWTIDAGFVRYVTVGDRVWYDQNHDGQQGDVADEPGVAGVVATLFAAATNQPVLRNGVPLTDVTDAAGNYLFTQLPPSAYFVVFTNLPAGYSPTVANVGDDASDSDADVTGRTTATPFLPGGAADLTLDMGIWRAPASLGDLVWEDLSGDGLQNGDEPGIARVTVTLTGADGSTATTTTDANGIYTFTNLTPGLPYTVTFDTPTGFGPTTPNVGVDDSVDSDGLTVPVSPLQPGEHNPTIDSGFVRLQSELALTKQLASDPKAIQPGATITYTLRYTNVGTGSAVGVVITETVSTHATFVAQASSAGWSCADGAAAGTLCTLLVGDLQPGQGGLVTFAIKIDLGVAAGTTIINSAVISNQQVGGVSAEVSSPVVGPTDIPIASEPEQLGFLLFLPVVTR
ncbi:MAG: SdrD B-like domain-containing protein [Caldilineaceae bacterium]